MKNLTFLTLLAILFVFDTAYNNAIYNYKATDVVEIMSGRVNYNLNWGKLSKIGIEQGFEWGGNWFNLVDKPHFQMTFGYHWSDLSKMPLLNSGFVRLK